MKHLKYIALAFMGLVFNIAGQAQGITIYCKDGTSINYPYDNISRIINYSNKDYPKISVSAIGEVVNESGFSVKVRGSVEGSSEPVEVGFLYGRTPWLSERQGKKVRTTSKDGYTVTLKGLIEGETYYYRPYARVGDCHFLGETKSFTKEGEMTYTMKDKTYKMVRVTGGIMPDFYIMQTELLVDEEIVYGSIKMPQLNKKESNAITRSVFKDYILALQDSTGLSFRLPTAEEWEYAAKGGQYSQGYKYSGSDDIEEVGWYSGNYQSNRNHDVALKKANELGLYDMSGNYFEVVYSDDFGVDGYLYGGYYKGGSYKCDITYHERSPRTGAVPGTNISENGSFNKNDVTIRLVFPVTEEN